MRQQDAYPQYSSALEVVLHDYALYKSTFTLPYFTLQSRQQYCATPAPFSGATSSSLIVCLYLLKTIKINAGVECMWGMKKISTILNEYLVDHSWTVACDQHLDGPV